MSSNFPPARFQRVSRRVRFAGGNGFDLSGIVDECIDRPNAPLVLFSHCFTCNKDLKAVVRISRRLAEQGMTVLRYDMTGLGGSDGDFSATNFQTNLADLIAAANFAAEHLRPPDALIGHSFGGTASLAAAANRAATPALQHLKCLVTLAAPTDTHHLAKLLIRMNPRIEKEGEGTVKIGGVAFQITTAMVEDFRSHFVEDMIGKIALPILVCHSPRDETVGFENAIRIMQLASNSDTPSPVSLLNLHEADHLFLRDADDLIYVADAIANFLHRYGERA